MRVFSLIKLSGISLKRILKVCHHGEGINGYKNWICNWWCIKEVQEQGVWMSRADIVCVSCPAHLSLLGSPCTAKVKDGPYCCFQAFLYCLGDLFIYLFFFNQPGAVQFSLLKNIIPFSTISLLEFRSLPTNPFFHPLNIVLVFSSTGHSVALQKYFFYCYI